MVQSQQPMVRVLGTAMVCMPTGCVSPLSARKERELLSVLALNARTVVSVDQLVDTLWGDRPPKAATTTLQGYIAHIRRSLEPDRAPRVAPTILRTAASGYLLDLPDTHIDAHDFARRAMDGLSQWRHVIGPPWPRLSADEIKAATRTVADLQEALRLWRGTAYADLLHEPSVEAEQARLNELHTSTVELVACLQLGLGDRGPVIAALERRVAEYPLRETSSVLLALALARSGRQSEALDVLRQLAVSLRDELGLDPSPLAQTLRGAILRQDAEFGLGGPAQQVEQRILEAPEDLIGRRDELGRIAQSLDSAVQGRGGAICLTGELGAGKSRLADEAARMAGDRRMTVIRMNLPEAPRAPGLWPIHQIMDQIGGGRPALPDGVPSDDELFYYFHEVIAIIREASAGKPMLININDVQWCDSYSLRALRLLVDALSSMPVVLLLSRRPGQRSGARSGLGSALARAGAVHLTLDGLDATEVVRLARTAGGVELNPAQGEELRRRTNGNAYFVIELARTGRPLDDDLPDTVVEVVESELQGLPPETLELLRAAAMIDMAFDVDAMARITGVADSRVIEMLEPAQAALLIRRSDAGYIFRHRLVRDVLVRNCPPTLREQLHADIASYLERRHVAADDQYAIRVAWHWRNAGAAHRGRAWRSTRLAAREAHRAAAHQDAADLFTLAVEVQRRDCSAELRERGALQLELARAQRAAGRWDEAHRAVHQAAVFAREADDLSLVSEAVTDAVEGGYWIWDRPSPLGQAWDELLTWFCESLPDEDSVIRCRAMILRTIESRTVMSPTQVDSMCEQAIDMSERLQDPRLLDHALRGSLLALRRPDTAQQRLALVDRLLANARKDGDRRAVARAGAIRAGLLAEAGEVKSMLAELPAASSAAERYRLWEVWGTLALLGSSWAGLRGDADEAGALLAATRDLTRAQSWGHFRGPEVLTGMLNEFWITGRCEPPVTEPIDSLETLIELLGVTLRARAGDLPSASSLAAVPLAIGGNDYRSLLTTCLSAELAAVTGNAAVAAEAIRWLEPFSGRMCSLGSVCLAGPVDAYLALACDAVGDHRADHFAERALDQARRWGLSPVAEWITTARGRASSRPEARPTAWPVSSVRRRATGADAVRRGVKHPGVIDPRVAVREYLRPASS